MDAKSLAKSKRAHSLHNKKKHQTHQGLKLPSAGSDDKKLAGKRPEKSQGQQIKEKVPQGLRGLPSNWERYDDDFNLASEEAQASSSLSSESVMPKSKGADYAHLISEATAQSQSHYSADVLPLFDDFVGDFTQDFGPMLAAKGQSMLSWITDDSFELEGKAGISPEVPFLSLNLDALAEQLSKAKLSERLYLHSDLLPLELLDEARDEDKHDPQTHTSAAETNTFSSTLIIDQAVTATGDLVQTSEEELNLLKQNTDETSQSREINRSISQKKESEHHTDSSSGKITTFEASSAEAELDMLLNSFNDTAIRESSGSSLAGIRSTEDASGESMKKGPHVDDAIDILLEETSAILDQQISYVSKANTEPISSNSKSKIVDDFDSWLDTI